MSRDYHQIYENHASDYDRLVSCEDRWGKLREEVARIIPTEATRVLDVGAGTGRFTQYLQKLGREVHALDAHAPMLEVLKQHYPSVTTHVSDYRHLPFEDGYFDVVGAAWALGHLTGTQASGLTHADFQGELRRALNEMHRIASKGATLLIVETMGTGTDIAHPPRPELGAFYEMLKTEYGFSATVLETDYLFPDRQTAEHLVTFFFGSAKVSRLQVASDSKVSLQEWTAVFHKRLAL